MLTIALQATWTAAGRNGVGLSQQIEGGWTQAVGQVLRATDEHGQLNGYDVLRGAGCVLCGTDPTLHIAARAQAILYLDIHHTAGQGLGSGC